jgi:hypothetical protein
MFPTALMPSTEFLDAVLFDTTYPVELMSIPSAPFLSVRFPDTGVVPEPGILDAMSMPSSTLSFALLLVTPASEIIGGKADNVVPLVAV